MSENTKVILVLIIVFCYPALRDYIKTAKNRRVVNSAANIANCERFLATLSVLELYQVAHWIKYRNNSSDLIDKLGIGKADLLMRVLTPTLEANPSLVDKYLLLSVDKL